MKTWHHQHTTPFNAGFCAVRRHEPCRSIVEPPALEYILAVKTSTIRDNLHLLYTCLYPDTATQRKAGSLGLYL
jgi:hypothetical protein